MTIGQGKPEPDQVNQCDREVVCTVRLLLFILTKPLDMR